MGLAVFIIIFLLLVAALVVAQQRGVFFAKKAGNKTSTSRNGGKKGQQSPGEYELLRSSYVLKNLSGEVAVNVTTSPGMNSAFRGRVFAFYAQKARVEVKLSSSSQGMLLLELPWYEGEKKLEIDGAKISSINFQLQDKGDSFVLNLETSPKKGGDPVKIDGIWRNNVIPPEAPSLSVNGVRLH